MGSSVRDAGKEHIPRYPPGWVTIRILQLIVAVVTLGLNAYLVTNWIYAGFYVQIWASVCTLIVSIWLICAHTCSPRAYNYWANMVLDLYLLFLWLASMAITAVNAAFLLTYHTSSSSDYDDLFGNDWDDVFDKLKMSKRYITYSGTRETSGAIAAASAGLGGVELLFFLICIIVNAVVIHRHRKAGLHSRPVRKYGASAAGGMSHPAAVPSAYQAVPQQGMPHQQLQQHDTAYNPHGYYNPQPVYQPQQQQQPMYQQAPAGQAYPYPVAKSVSPAPTSTTPTPQPYSPQPQHPVTQPPTGGY